MARIPDTLFNDFKEGETVHAPDYTREREIMRVAINDFDDKVNSVIPVNAQEAIAKVPVLETGLASANAQLSDIVINIKQFGAKSLEVDTSFDSTTAIKNTIASLGTTGGKVLIPKGTYKVTDTITIPEKVTLTGTGKRSTIIDYRGSNDAFVLASGGVKYVGMEGIYVTNNGTSLIGLVVSDSWYGKFRDLVFDGFNAQGLSLRNTKPDFGIYWNIFEEIDTPNSTSAGIVFQQSGSAAINLNTFLNCRFNHGSTKKSLYGAYLQNTSCENVFIACDFSYSSSYNIRLEGGASRNLFQGCYSEQITPGTSKGFSADATSKNNKYYAGLIYNNSVNVEDDSGMNEVDSHDGTNPIKIVIGAMTVNVKNFGAKGDGTADDTTAIQNTINFVKTKGGGTVEFPPGTYKVSSTLIIDSHYINLKGSGIISKIVNSNTAGLDCINIKNGTIITPFFMAISDLWIQGNGLSGHGIKVAYAYNVTLRDVYLNGHGGDGVYSLHGMNSVMQRVRSDENNAGFSLNQIDPGSRSTTWSLTDCYFGSNRGVGGILSGGDSNVLNKCLFEGNAGSGLYITNDEVNPNLHSCYFESNVGYSINVDSGRSGYMFGGRFADENVTAHMNLGNTTGWVINGAWFTGNSLGGGVNINKGYAGGVDMAIGCFFGGVTPIANNSPNVKVIGFTP